MIFKQSPVLIAGFPIPPSDNELKMPIRRFKKGGGGRVMTFCDSAAYTAYKSNVNVWWMQYNQTYADFFNLIRQWVNDGEVLGCALEFRVHRSRIWTKEGKVKRIDPCNRLKGLHDCFSQLVGFDDTLFFKTSIEKVEIPDNRKECFYLRIGPIEARKEYP